MSLSSWGNYPKVSNNTFKFDQDETLKNIIHDHNELIPFGNGRSYGDSALSENIITVKPRDLFLNFDESKGILHIQSGVFTFRNT